MISHTEKDTSFSFQETLIFSSLVFALGVLSLWTVLEGSAPAMLFLLILALSFVATFLFPRSGMMALVSSTIIFQRYFTQAPLIYNETLIKLYPMDAILGGALLFWIATLLIRRTHAKWLASDKWILLFFGYMTVLLVVAVFGGGLADGAIAFSTWKNYVFYGCFYFVVREIFSGADGRRLLGKTFLLTVTASLIFLVIGIVRGGGLWTEYTPLSTSGIRLLDFPHALYFSLAFLALFLLSVTAKHLFGAYEKFFAYILPILLVIGIVGGLMRHLWVALFCGMVAGFILLSTPARGLLLRRIAIFAGTFAVIGMLGVSLLALAPQSSVTHLAFGAVSSFVERVVSISDAGIDESVAWRFSVWQSALERLVENPFLGTGLGQNVPVELGDYRAFVVVRNIHNSWFALLVQTGVVGAGLFLMFLFSLARNLYQKTGTSQEVGGMRAVFGSLLVFYSVVFLFQPYLESNILATFFWMLLGLIGAFISDNKEESI